MMQLKPGHSNWKGTLQYGPTYGIYAGKELHFELEIAVTDHSWVGICKDISGLGVHPEPAKVQGNWQEGKIWFQKQYPYRHELNRNGEMIFRKKEQSPLITYSGTWNPELQAWQGEWEVRDTLYLLGIFPIKRVGKGSWSMTSM